MQTTGNTILITGGGSGIGRALAEAFAALGNTVIVAGRRQAALEDVVRANPGMRAAALDIDNADAIRTFGAQMATSYPALNAVIHMAGIMRAENVQVGSTDVAEATIVTNLLGTIRLTAALLPQLLHQPHAAILTVSSGLAFLPRADNPTYCASKAAIHSYTQSLRYQLKDTAVQVIELVPPYVQTGLTGDFQAHDPMAMPLADYIAQTMHILTSSPDTTEVLVDRVMMQRGAEASGDYASIFTRFNDTLAAAVAARKAAAG